MPFQCDLGQGRNVGDRRLCHRVCLCATALLHALRHLSRSTDIGLCVRSSKSNGGSRIRIDHVAQLVDVALNSAHGLDDPNLGLDLGRAVANESERGDLGLGGSRADDVTHEGNVVELVLEAGRVGGVAEVVELSLVGCSSDEHDGQHLCHKLGDDFDGPVNVAGCAS